MSSTTTSQRKGKYPYGFPVLALIAVALVLSFCFNAPVAGIGFAILIGSLALAAAWFVAVTRERSFSVVGAALVGVIGIASAVALLSLAGFIVRFMADGAYVGRYGTEVEATVSDDCFYFRGTRTGGSSDYQCKGSTWAVDGAPRTGTLHVSWKDSEPDKKTYHAWALEDTAFTQTGAHDDFGVAYLGRFPVWPLLPAVPVGVVALMALGAIDWWEPRTEAST